jgi:nitroreductase
VATRPKVHRCEVSRAIVMIAKRRAKVDDRNRDRLPDSPDSDPRETLVYLQKYSGADIPRWVLQADVCDALTLNNWLWWEDRRHELHFLKAGRDRGLFLAQIGAQVGVGKQGVVDRIDRLEALLRYDRPDEKIIRAARLSDRQARERRPAEDHWLAAHRDHLLSVITGMVAEADRYALADEEREWLEELAIEGRTAELTPASMVILGLAAAELRTAPAILALDGVRPYAVHGVLRRADQLRCGFADCGTTTAPITERHAG